MKTQFDVVILGSGLVGLTMGTLLAQETRLSICIIDKQPPSTDFDTSVYDSRCSAITPNSQSLFETIGIWHNISQDRCAAFNAMEIWDAQTQAHLKFDAAHLAKAQLGHIIENRVIQKALWEKFSTQQNCTFIQGMAIDFIIKDNNATITIKHENHPCSLTSKLCIGADGANSWLRNHLQIPTTQKSYDQKALVATIQCEHPHQFVARQCFTATGPLAFLPLADPYLCSIVWSASPEHIDSLLALSDFEFEKTLAIGFEHTLGYTTLAGPRKSFPLTMKHAQRYIAEQVALIGDAAHVIHPLAGQGVNLGFLDAKALSNTIKRNKQCFAHITALRQYERARKGHNTAMVQLMEIIKNSFNTTNPLVSTLRGNSFNLLNSVPWLKRHIAEFAMGTTSIFSFT